MTHKASEGAADRLWLPYRNLQPCTAIQFAYASWISNIAFNWGAALSMARKTVIIIPDGCADFPVDSLNGRTPLQAAHVPAMDMIAKLGVIGQSNNVPPQYTPGSEVANMSLFGYDPDRFFTGRAPIEAAAKDIQLGPDDFAIRCNWSRFVIKSWLILLPITSPTKMVENY